MIRTVATGYAAQAQSFGIGNAHTDRARRAVSKLAQNPSMSLDSKLAVGEVLKQIGAIMAENPAANLKSRDFNNLGDAFEKAGRPRPEPFRFSDWAL